MQTRWELRSYGIDWRSEKTSVFLRCLLKTHADLLRRARADGGGYDVWWARLPIQSTVNKYYFSQDCMLLKHHVSSRHAVFFCFFLFLFKSLAYHLVNISQFAVKAAKETFNCRRSLFLPHLSNLSAQRVGIKPLRHFRLWTNAELPFVLQLLPYLIGGENSP